MPTGNQAPFISQQSVRLALDMLVYSTSRKQSPLLSLLLVDEFLANPDLPNSSHSREFALYQILTSILTSEFAHQRSVFQYNLPQPTDSKVVAVQIIRRDAESDSPELIGWSWLYHQYVRVDLNIPFQEFCHLVHIDERTLRRYQQHAIKRLTDLLIEMEWDSRTRQRKRRLLSELPTAATFPPLIGREDVSAFVRQMLGEAQPPHFQIAGSRGIGKTAFVESVLQAQINMDEVEQLIWIQMPISAEYISYHLRERLLPPEAKFTLREYLLTHRTFIVLDDIELLCNNLATLRILLQLLSPAVVFMTCSTYVPVPNTVGVTLQEFSEQDTQAFARSLFTKIENPALIISFNEYLHSIWERAGGNPLAIQLITSSLSYLDFSNFNGDFGLDALFSQVFQALDKSVQNSWIALTLSPPREMQFNALCKLWSTHIRDDDIGILLQYHLVEISTSQHPRYRLINSARCYIEDMYQTASHVRQMVDNLIRDLDNLNTGNMDFVLPLLEHILQATWVELDAATRETWISKWWVEGVKQQHWSTWRLLLESQIQRNPIDLNLYMGYAVCLRSLGEWELTQQTLELVLSETGRQGKFIKQVEVLLELSIVLRYRGEYEKAVELLTHAHQIARRQKSENLISALAVEQAQVAIDLHDPVAAATFIVNLPDTARTQVFRSEIYLLQGDYEQSRLLAQLALKSASSDLGSSARIYTLIGRTYEQQNDLERAQEYFSWAVMVLEQQEDVFALARTQANLGALFTRTGHYEDADILLNSAEKVQARLKDRVALAATRHNLKLLRIAFSS